MLCPACELEFSNADSLQSHLESHYQYELVEAIIDNEQYKQKINEMLTELQQLRTEQSTLAESTWSTDIKIQLLQKILNLCVIK